MANHISPAAQLFRSMADLIDQDHTSHTDYDAVTRAAEASRPAPAPSSWWPARCRHRQPRPGARRDQPSADRWWRASPSRRPHRGHGR